MERTFQSLLRRTFYTKMCLWLRVLYMEYVQAGEGKTIFLFKIILKDFVAL